MYLEHFQLKIFPFRQEPDPEILFPGAGRNTVLHGLLEDLRADKPLIKLTGSEGVGKTLFYLLFARKVSLKTCDLVCLDHPVGSFDDLLRIICNVLGIVANGEIEKRNCLEEFRAYLRLQKERQRKVILIIDEAEKLFLATLERLVRMICDNSEAGGILQILLIGRLELDLNLDQLAIYCANIDFNTGYILKPLTFEETSQYLHYRLRKAGIPENMHEGVFTDDAVAAIFQAAAGNISLTNVLADKGLSEAYSQGLFQVTAEQVTPHYGEDKNITGVFVRLLEFLRVNKTRTVAGAVILLLFLLVALWPGKREETPEVAPGDQVEIEVPPVTAESPVQVEDPAMVVPEVAVEVETAKDPPVEDVAVQKPETVQPEMSQPETSQPETGEPETIVVKPGTKKKKRSDLPVKIEEEKPGIEPKVLSGEDGGNDLVEPEMAASDRDGLTLLQERMRASSSWLAWAYRGGYTIQLMVLASDKAESNLRDMLVQDEYYSIRDELYVLRKTSPSTLYVFYGLYDSIKEAREVRNNMPVFLRKHHPYALSINEALKKTED